MILSTFWSRYYSRMMLSTVIIKYLFSNNNYSVKALLSKKNMKNLRKKFCEFPPDSFYLVDKTIWKWKTQNVSCCKMICVNQTNHISFHLIDKTVWNVHYCKIQNVVFYKTICISRFKI